MTQEERTEMNTLKAELRDAKAEIVEEREMRQRAADKLAEANGTLRAYELRLQALVESLMVEHSELTARFRRTEAALRCLGVPGMGYTARLCVGCGHAAHEGRCGSAPGGIACECIVRKEG